MGRSKAPPPIAPDAPLGMTYSEIFALPQLQMQLTAIVVVHLFLAWSLPKWKNGPFAVKPQTAAHLAPFITCFTWMAYQGVSLWLFDPVIADPSFDRKFGEHAGAQTLIVSMLAIQLCEFGFVKNAQCMPPPLRGCRAIAHATPDPTLCRPHADTNLSPPHLLKKMTCPPPSSFPRCVS